MTATVTCPSCGAQTSGKFCSACGQPLGDRACPKCGTKLSPRAKFCPNCGTTAAAGKGGAAALGRSAGDRFPWIIAGLAVLALVATVIVVITRRPAPAADAAAFDPNRGTTDITNMSPREAADRLFNRVMTADAAGDTSQVQFFGPMTVQAYSSVTPLDPDARLHIGLVHLKLGNAAGAAAQADTVARSAPTHLFVFALRAEAARLRADPAATRQAYQGFTRNYDAEMRKNLQEYQDHRDLLAGVRTAAQGDGSAPR